MTVDLGLLVLWSLTLLNSLAVILLSRQITLFYRGLGAPRGPQPGWRVPAWSLPDLDGLVRSSADFSAYLLLVTAPRCAPCRTLMEDLQKHGTVPRQPIVMAVEGTATEVRAWTGGLPPGVVSTVLVGADVAFKERLKIPGTPHAIAIAADGRVAAAGVVNAATDLQPLLRRIDGTSVREAVEASRIAHS
jgi:hypothetical protein